MVRNRKGAGEVRRTEKYQNGMKKKGSRRGGENGKVYGMEIKRKGAGKVGRTETIQNDPFVQNKL